MKEVLKNVLMFISKVFLSIFKLYPLQKSIMFCSLSGKSYSCNPKYIYEYIKNNNKYYNYKFIWTFKDPSKYKFLEDKKTKICKYRSIKYYFYRITSKVYITNAIEGNEVPKKKKQIIVQTWHGGGAYKKVALAEKNKSAFYKYRTKLFVNNTNLFLSSCEIFTNEEIRNNFEYNGEVLECGLPRNDILFKTNIHKEIKNKVLKKYHISDGKYLVLYAPTWRYDESKVEKIDFEKLKKSFREKFKKDVVILFRAHLHIKTLEYNNLINVSDYDDMQELLIACDSMITDYSSCVWDFSFLNKPCFLFCPDLDYYINNRGFIVDIHKWGFPIAINNNELNKNVINFNKKNFEKKQKEHHSYMNSFENGNACEKVNKYLIKMLDEE